MTNKTFYFQGPGNHLQKIKAPRVMIFFPKITETNSRTLQLPLPNQDIQPTKQQQSQPLVTHHKIARRAHKARALRGSITSCHHQNTNQSRKVVELPRAQESTDKLPTSLKRLLNTRREHAPSHLPTSCTARNGVGAFLRPPHRNRKTDHLP